jgi:hypothetical protein
MNLHIFASIREGCAIGNEVKFPIAHPDPMAYA